MPRNKFRNNGLSSNSNFNEDDRKLLCEVDSTVKSLVNEIQIFKELRVNKEKLDQATDKNNLRKQLINLNHYKLDNSKQYDRRENLRVYNKPETATKKMVVSKFL